MAASSPKRRKTHPARGPPQVGDTYCRTRQNSRRSATPRLCKENRKRLNEKPKYGFKSYSRHLDTIKDMLRQNNGIVCSDRTLRRALRKMRFSYRKASRTVPHNPTSREEQVAFMESARERVVSMRENGHAILTEDEFAVLL